MTTTPIETRDTIDAILGVATDGPIAALRATKPELARQDQAYYESIFEPTEASARELSVHDRALVAVRVASHTNSEAVAKWYAELAARHGATANEIEQARDLTNAWSTPTALGAAIRHADLLTTSPASASADDLQQLKNAGFSPTGIVSLSQTIAFVSYQLRLIAGLRALGGAQ
jgi:CMD domain protein